MIKRLLTAILFFPMLAMAQSKEGEPVYISKTLTAQAGEVYLDSIKIDREKTFLDPENIKEVRVFKGQSSGAESGIQGATLITRNVQGDIISLNDFAASLKAGSGKLKKAKSIRLMVNDAYIDNPEEYRIELSSVRKVSIVNFREDESTHVATATVLITIKGYKGKEE